MPRGDGIGPIGLGSMTGRGLGPCSGVNAMKNDTGFGLGCRRGFGRGLSRSLSVSNNSSKTQKELLQEQKDLLQSRLEVIDKQLENM